MPENKKEDPKGFGGNRRVLEMLGEVKETVERTLREVASAWEEYRTQKPLLDAAIARIERRQRLIIQAVNNILTGQQDEAVIKALTDLLNKSEEELQSSVDASKK